MNFSVNVHYLHSIFIYEVTTQDEHTFTCVRKSGEPEEEFAAPPEVLVLTLGEEPQPAVWGKSLTELYCDLHRKITAYLQQQGSDQN